LKKAQIVSAIASDTGLTKRTCDELMNSLLEIITTSLINHVPVEIMGLGSFDIRVREVREDNMQKAASTDIKYWRPVFTPSKEFKDRFNKEYTKSYSVEVVKNKSKNQSVTFDANLNNQSKLGELGYSIQLSRDERWDILKLKAIPRYGINEVRSHILWLVRLKKKDRHRDYSNAIFEWEYDLKRLEKI